MAGVFCGCSRCIVSGGVEVSKKRYMELLLQWSIQKIGMNADIVGYQFQDQILYMAIGFAVMLIICFVDYNVISRWIHVLAVCFVAGSSSLIGGLVL